MTQDQIFSLWVAENREAPSTNKPSGAEGVVVKIPKLKFPILLQYTAGEQTLDGTARVVALTTPLTNITERLMQTQPKKASSHRF
jgi:hypothetical protein